MNKALKDFRELVLVTSEKLDLPDLSVIEKDFYVTKAIHLVSDIGSEYLRLVFQGGTSLAKAHRLIERMSEDSDWRIQQKSGFEFLSKEQRRKHLREFRHEIVANLKKEFIIKDPVRVRNEGQFMRVDLEYESIFETSSLLRPYLQMEFFLADVKIEPITLPTTTLIQQTLGAIAGHTEKEVHCISILETAAEKWVALTRRVATMEYRQNYRDASLVRHIYDLYQIHEKGHLKDDKFYDLVTQIVQTERKQYKNHNAAYVKEPVKEIKKALYALQHDKIWQTNWNNFIKKMVYQPEKPNFEIALKKLDYISHNTIKVLQKA